MIHASSFSLSASLSLQSSSSSFPLAAALASSTISRHVLHASRKNAAQMISPPTIAAAVSGLPEGIIWSTTATRKMVSRAATLERTGLVSEMRTRKEPEKTALEKTEIVSSQAALPCGSSKVSQPIMWKKGMGIQRMACSPSA